MSTIFHDAPLDQEVLSCHCWKPKCFHFFSELPDVDVAVIIFDFWMPVTSAQCPALLPTMCADACDFICFFLPHNPTNDPATYCNTLSKPCYAHPQHVSSITLTADNWWPCGNVANNNIVSMAMLTFDCQSREKCCSGAPLTNYRQKRKSLLSHAYGVSPIVTAVSKSHA